MDLKSKIILISGPTASGKSSFAIKIANNSPITNSIELNSIIVEAQKKKIRSADDLRNITKEVLNSNQKTVLLAIYNNQNQRRYIGVKLD